jgi:di/tricarboxylate transporter
LLLLTVVLLLTERIRTDLVAMITLSMLVLLRLIGPEEALSGFANPATVTVACMFVLSAGLQSSGVVQFLGDRLVRYGPTNSYLLTFFLGTVVGPISAFINNTAAVAIFLPVAMQAGEARKIPPSKILLALSYFAMMGGVCTLVGTSTNILVSSVAEAHGKDPFSMFEFSGLGLLLFAAGTVYMMTLGFHWTPTRETEASLTRSYHLNRYLSEVIVLPGSPLTGQSLVEAKLGERFDLEVLSLIRNSEMRGLHGEHLVLREGDILLVKAAATALIGLRDAAGIGVRPGRHPGDAELTSSSSVLVEVVLPPNTRLEDRTLKGANFRTQYGATTLAVRRQGEDICEKIGKLRLRVGDELLLLADRTNLARLRSMDDFVFLQELDVPILDPTKALMALGIVVGVVGAAAGFGVPIVSSALVGAVAMVASNCLPVRKVYREIDWKVIFLFFILTSLLTGFLSNAATAALLAPIALTAAEAIGVDSRPFLVALTFAASAAFWTPVGYQTNLLVYGPGGYRFMDFVRVGGPLTLIYALLGGYLIPIFFPF